MAARESRFDAGMVLFLHNRYRTTGGEERAVDDLLWLVREHLDEPAELLAARLSGRSGARARRSGCCAAGSSRARWPARCALSGARVVHAHNLQPTLGWRALAAARAAGARVVLHLHQYRLVCAIGVCYTRGAECTRCHGRDTLPGVRLNCRGSLPEALAYGAVAGAVAAAPGRAGGRGDRPQRVRPRAPARAGRAAAVGARPRARAAAARPLDGAAEREPGRRRQTAARWRGHTRCVVSRLAPEKGVDVAIDACRIAGMPAGRRRRRARARERCVERAGDGAVRFAGRVDDAELARLRAGAAIALAPSRSGETFGLAAAEAMAAGLPVAASRVGALPELVDGAALVPPGDARALAAAIARLAGDRQAGERGRARVRAVCAPEVVGAGAGGRVRRRARGARRST